MAQRRWVALVLVDVQLVFGACKSRGSNLIKKFASWPIFYLLWARVLQLSKVHPLELGWSMYCTKNWRHNHRRLSCENNISRKPLEYAFTKLCLVKDQNQGLDLHICTARFSCTFDWDLEGQVDQDSSWCSEIWLSIAVLLWLTACFCLANPDCFIDLLSIEALLSIEVEFGFWRDGKLIA